MLTIGTGGLLVSDSTADIHRVVRWSLDRTGLFVDCPKVFWRTNVDAAVRKPKARALRKLDKRFKLSSTMVVNPLRSCEDNKNILDSSLQYCSSSWNGWCLDFVNCNSEYRWSLAWERSDRPTVASGRLCFDDRDVSSVLSGAGNYPSLLTSGSLTHLKAAKGKKQTQSERGRSSRTNIVDWYHTFSLRCFPIDSISKQCS